MMVDKVELLENDLTPAIVGSNGYMVTGKNMLPFMVMCPISITDSTLLLFPENLGSNVHKHPPHNYLMEDMNLIVFKPIDKFLVKSIHLVIRLPLSNSMTERDMSWNDVVKEGFFVFMIMLVLLCRRYPCHCIIITAQSKVSAR